MRYRCWPLWGVLVSMPAETIKLQSWGSSFWRSLPDDIGLLAAAAGAAVFTFLTITPSEYDWRATLTGNHTVVWLVVILTAVVVRWRRSRRDEWRDWILVCALLFISLALNALNACVCDFPPDDTANNHLITFDMAN